MPDEIEELSDDAAEAEAIVAGELETAEEQAAEALQEAAHAAGQVEHATSPEELHAAVARLSTALEAHLAAHVMEDHSHEHEHEQDHRLMTLLDAIDEIDQEERAPVGKRTGIMQKRLWGHG